MLSIRLTKIKMKRISIAPFKSPVCGQENSGFRLILSPVNWCSQCSNEILERQTATDLI
jgi:hypothetical protein